MVSLREKYPLESTKPLKKTIARSFALIILLGFFFLFFVLPFAFSASAFKKSFMIVPIILIGGLFLIILIIVLIYVYEVYYMKYYFYDATNALLLIRKGVFSRNEISIPFNRLQDVYVDQDILDRIFGLYDVHVSSATITSGFLSHIDGVNKENSEKLKELILNAIHSKK